jgi:AraC-like DNA-binding protein
MHELECANASPRLAPYIRLFAQRRVFAIEAPLVEPVPARLEPIIEFPLRNPAEVIFNNGVCGLYATCMIIGPQTYRRGSVVLRGNNESFGVFFWPSGFSRLFGVPFRTLLNEAYEASSVVGAWIQALWIQVAECNTFKERVQAVEQALLRFAARLGSADSMFEAAERILGLRGVVSVRTAAQDQGLGLRHFERRFADRIGISPKRYARIARFQSALDAKVASPRRTWLEIAHELHYHDQMHMIHDFRSLAGGTPGEVLAALGDMRPPALALRGEIHSI